MLREYFSTLEVWLREKLGPQIDRLRERVDPLVAQGRARYQKLETRERVLVQIGAALVAIFLFYNLIYTPIVDFSSGLDQRITQREHDL